MVPSSARRATPHWALPAVLCLVLCACFGPLPAANDASRSQHAAEHYFDGKALDLAIAAEHGDAGTIRRLMRDEKVDPDTIFAKGEMGEGMPLVAWPVFTENPEGLKAMLENGADPNARRPERIDKRYDDGTESRKFRYNNALVYAAQAEDPIYLKLLLDHGGDPNTVNTNDEPLTFVAFLHQNQWQNVKLRIERGAKVNDDSVYPGSPLDWYAGRGGFEQVYWLLQHGADPAKKVRGTALAPTDAKGTPLPQPDAPADGFAWIKYGKDGKPVYVDGMPIVENIYWHPGSPKTLEWQRKCQQWLRKHGIARPPMPASIRTMRKSFGFPTEEKDVPLL
ncbi:MAG: ankyrin repeat domain-containing protein [Lysobacteraceae bacterium]